MLNKMDQNEVFSVAKFQSFWILLIISILLFSKSEINDTAAQLWGKEEEKKIRITLKSQFKQLFINFWGTFHL